MQSEQINELTAALAKAQGAMKNATLNRINPHFKSRYADLASVLDAIRGPLANNGLAITQVTEIRDGAFVLRTMLNHVSGQWVASDYPLPSGAKPQEMGSALTYARRYSLSALISISADDDDDAEGAEKGKQTVEVPAGKIDEQQVEWLQTMIVEAGADLPAFLKYLGIKRLEDLTTDKMPKATDALNKKRADTKRREPVREAAE